MTAYGPLRIEVHVPVSTHETRPVPGFGTRRPVRRYTAGSRISNAEPAPGSLQTVTQPPCWVTIA